LAARRPGTGTVANKRALELGNASEHGQHHLPCGRRCVGPGLAQRLQTGTGRRDRLNQLQKVARWARQSVERCDHDHVALARLLDHAPQFGTVGPRPGFLLGVADVHSGDNLANIVAAKLRFRLNRWLYALCWTGTDRPSVLFDRAVAWLLANKVVLPGLTQLERAVARVRSRANERLWQHLTERVTPEQRQRLESLLIVPQGERTSARDRLRDGPVLQSPAELARAIEDAKAAGQKDRLGSIRDLDA
jgi:hypothetical protein